MATWQRGNVAIKRSAGRMHMLIGHFGRNPYFERRKGQTALSSGEQPVVRKALRQAGIIEELKFDQYGENFNWYD